MSKLVKLHPEMIEFLEDHSMAYSNVLNLIFKMMSTSASTRDDVKQMTKICKKCEGYDVAHKEKCSFYNKNAFSMKFDPYFQERCAKSNERKQIWKRK